LNDFEKICRNDLTGERGNPAVARYELVEQNYPDASRLLLNREVVHYEEVSKSVKRSPFTQSSQRFVAFST
jgi:hypothetical protein